MEVIGATKATLRTNLGTAFGTDVKTVAGFNTVTTLKSSAGSDPANGGISNTGKGKNPQEWYYSSGWSAFNTAAATGWSLMAQPNAVPADITTGASSVSTNYNALTLRAANLTDSTSATIVTGLGNTYYGSSVAPLSTLLDAVETGNTAYGAKLDQWTVGGANAAYNAATAAALTEAYNAALAAETTPYNVIYQPYVDYLAMKLKAAIDGLQYVAAGSTPNSFVAADFRRPAPNVELAVSDVTRVGAYGDTNMARGTWIKKAIP